KQATNAVANITTGGSATMTLDDRLAASLVAEPEMCSLNMGSMNFALYPAAARITDWKHDWEKPFLEGSENLVFKNTPQDIAHVITEMGGDRGARFEFECYDLSHLYMLRHFADRGLVKAPFFIQFVFGVLGGMGADHENLTHVKRIADKLFGDDYEWSVLAAGRHQIPFATMAAAMGGHVRVGLEDSIYICKGELAKSNAQQVERIREIVERLGREVATPDEARTILGLKGADKTAF
ncbi:MAG: 3-keto-5-aminohexanoate cleavage protein, partial [Rhodospirillales bacterium]|nr:3-keto-5-aminohexanoate cleavage protein [Rhodospirillales bacterium]